MKTDIKKGDVVFLHALEVNLKIESDPTKWSSAMCSLARGVKKSTPEQLENYKTV